MIGKNIIFNDKKINVGVYKILVSKKESYRTKNSLEYFIGYNDGFIRPLCIKLPQMVGYVKYFYSNKALSLKVIDNKLLKKVYYNMEKSQQFYEYKI